MAVAGPSKRAEGQAFTTNGDAETGSTADWTTTEWQALRYDALPAGTHPPHNSNGAYLFVTSSVGAAMSQTVSVAAAAADIDAGNGPVYVQGDLGATGSQPTGAEVLAQPLDANGQPLGDPTQAGPPSLADRDGKSDLVGCYERVTTPVGTRQVTVTVRATGPTDDSDLSIADGIALSWGHAVPASLPAPIPGDGPGCERAATYDSTATPTPTSSPAPTASPSPAATPTPTATPTVITYPTGRRVEKWMRPRRADGFTPTKLRRHTRKVRIELPAVECATGMDIKVRRQRHTVVITTVFDIVLPTSGPYPMSPPCPMPRAEPRTVSLHGTLGLRSVSDGAVHPPRVRYPALTAASG